MKKIYRYLLIGALLVGIIYAASFFITTNIRPAMVYDTISPTTRTIKKQTIVTGKVIPEHQVEIKPQVSGIIEKVFVREGDVVNAGDLIATIKVIPSESALNSALGRVSNAKIVLNNTKIDYERNKKLLEKSIISMQDFNASELSYKQAEQELVNAQNDLQIIRLGTAGGGSANTNIRATVSGTVLEIPIKKGDQVIESNNFNPGTTVAHIADLTQMIFEGKIDEAEVGNLKVGMPLKITMGALGDSELNAQLRFVAPQGIEDQGAVQFKIEAMVSLDSSVFVRAGYSANAKIVLQEATDVLAIKEALVQFDEKTNQPFVEVETSVQEFERKAVKLGLSDGIYVAIDSGITTQDAIKEWNVAAPVEESPKPKKKRR